MGSLDRLGFQFRLGWHPGTRKRARSIARRPVRPPPIDPNRGPEPDTDLAGTADTADAADNADPGAWSGWFVFGPFALGGFLVVGRIAWRSWVRKRVVVPPPVTPVALPVFRARPAKRAQDTSIMPAVAPPGYPGCFVLRRFALGLRPKTGEGIAPDPVFVRHTIGLRLRGDPGTHTIAESVPRDITRPED